MKEFIRNFLLVQLGILGVLLAVVGTIGLLYGITSIIIYLWPHLNPDAVTACVPLGLVWFVFSFIITVTKSGEIT